MVKHVFKSRTYECHANVINDVIIGLQEEITVIQRFIASVCSKPRQAGLYNISQHKMISIFLRVFLINLSNTITTINDPMV